MPRIPKQAQTDGSTTFDPDKFFESWSKEEITPPYDNNFRRFIIRSFGLPLHDDYGYRAATEVTLLQAQTHVEFGAQGGLHRWYVDENGQEVSTKETPLRAILMQALVLSGISEISTPIGNGCRGIFGYIQTDDQHPEVAKWTPL